ncbi:MAG: PLP-dependent lyase/thiolase [Candidatus Abawacabacteria bacterium]|nr:PLP-dependent lyase/thiolase [Candidatus Abawacabacteria bacterium]
MLFSGINKRRFDIWRYQALYPHHLSDDALLISDQRKEFTALEQRYDTLWIKHEDEHPLGSHKGRSLAYQLSVLTAAGHQRFVLSSSGNAAIAFLSLTPSLQSFAIVSSHIDAAKLHYLQNLSTVGHVIMSSVAPNLTRALVKQKEFIDLRPSQSEDAIIGLSSLGFELFEQMPDLSDQYAIVSVTTSGGNVLGMHRAFSLLQQQGLIKSLPRLYPVLLENYPAGHLSPERRRQLVTVVAESKSEILVSSPVYNGQQLTSFEGNTAYQVYEQNKQKLGKTIVLFTGRIWPVSGETATMPMYQSLAALVKNYSL